MTRDEATAMAAHEGRLHQMRAFAQQSRELADRMGMKDFSAEERAQEALLEMMFMNKTLALQDVTQALKQSRSPDVVLDAATTLALAGQDNRAKDLTEETAKRRPEDTILQFVSIPLVQAQIEANHGNAAMAIQILDRALIYAQPSSMALYIRGNIYLKAGSAKEAADTFQRLLNTRRLDQPEAKIPLAHLGLARANALQARTEQGAASDAAHTRALAAYEDFFGLWKDADPDIPILQQAKAEYARLH